jgi:hypothetical protein
MAFPRSLVRAYLPALMGGLLLVLGCGKALPLGPTDAGDARLPAADAPAPLDGVVIRVDPACSYKLSSAPVLVSADALGAGVRFLAMARGVLQATADLGDGPTDVLVRVPLPPSAPAMVKVDGLLPTARIRTFGRETRAAAFDAGSTEVEQAVFCDETACRVFVFREDAFVEDQYPPLPLGDWDEIFPQPFPKQLAVRGRGLICYYDGATWKIDRQVPEVSKTVPACLAANAVLLDASYSAWTSVGIDAESRVVIAESTGTGEVCCPMWQVDSAFEIRTFYFGEAGSIWVLSPSVLFGSYLTGHD